MPVEWRKLMPGWFVIAGWLRSGSPPLSVSQMAKPWRSHKQHLWTYQCNQGRGLNKGWPHHSSWWVCHHFSPIYVQIVHSAERHLLGMMSIPAWSRWGLIVQEWVGFSSPGNRLRIYKLPRMSFQLASEARYILLCVSYNLRWTQEVRLFVLEAFWVLLLLEESQANPTTCFRTQQSFGSKQPNTGWWKQVPK